MKAHAIGLLACSIFSVQAQQHNMVPHLPNFTLYDKPGFDTPGALSNAWADYDNDGDLDLVVSFKSGEIRLYQNNLGELTPVGESLGLPSSGIDGRSIAWGDWNNDGFPDLFIGTFQRPYHQYNLFYENENGKRFVEKAAKVGVLLPNTTARQGSWIDYDNDGDLDFYQAQRMGGNRMFRNDDDHFTDTSKMVGLYDPRRSVGVCWFDADQNGFLDAFVANQSGDRDGYYQNKDGSFTDVAHQYAMDHPLRPLNEGGVGCAVGDFNNDGHFDIFVATYGEDLLYQNDGKGGFTEVAAQMGITGNHHHVSAQWGDVNNDGLLDLYVVGFRGNDIRARDYLYLNTGNGFVDALPDNVAKSDSDHGIQLVDFDLDGDLDLSFTHSDNTAGHQKLFINQLNSAGRSLLVAPVNAVSGSLIPGAEVRIFDKDNHILASRLVDTGGGYNAQNSISTHFGFPNITEVSVQVTFLTETGRSSVLVPNINLSQWQGKVLRVSHMGVIQQ